jgi:hypothetical protein
MISDCMVEVEVIMVSGCMMEDEVVVVVCSGDVIETAMVVVVRSDSGNAKGIRFLGGIAGCALVMSDPRMTDSCRGMKTTFSIGDKTNLNITVKSI